jgi:hypothetical protein
MKTLSVALRIIVGIGGLTWIWAALKIWFTDSQLSKSDSIFTCVMTATFSLVLAFSTYKVTIGSENQ